ncbi:MAG: UbiA family prenyltransferase [Pseudomonadales bacterium]|nr:UbiA family prenyltransferase [Pseudomonadales bacterium]
MSADVHPPTPLVVDLDGTLTPTDTLIESVLKLIKQEPLCLLQMPLWLCQGRAAFKSHVAQRVDLSASTLPYRQALLHYLREQKARGRTLVLATAAHDKIAVSVADHLGLFDQVLATTEQRNLKGAAKLDAIRQEVGEQFAYAGDSAADVEIWAHSVAAILVGPAVQRYQGRQVGAKVEQTFRDRQAGLGTWLRALRAHQWTKNLLLFVPLLTSFGFVDQHKILLSVLSFCAFCLVASATYLLNDLWDLESDRRHPTKCLRPLASAEISIAAALLAAAVGLCGALALGSVIGMQFLLALAVYLLITSVYSWTLKQIMLIDVLVLALLYTLRILAGSFAIHVTTSPWLLAFSIFLFFSLALVKRCSELVALPPGETRTPGRDYHRGDLAVLWPLGTAAGLCSVIVLGLFVTTLVAEQRYATPELLWLVGVGLLYWISRLWIKTNRGEMHEDPIVFAIKDRNSLLTIVAMIAVTLIAYFVPLTLL